MTTPAAGAGRRRTAATPPLVDDFAGTFSTTTWPNSYGGPANVSGRLRIPCTSGYPTAATNDVFDLAAYPLHIQLVTVPLAGNGGTQTQFFIRNQTAASSAGFEVLAATSLRMVGQGQSTTSITYNATSHAWLRMSVSGGNLLWETSPDKAVWTTQRTLANPSWTTSALLRVNLSCGYFGTETTPGNAEFDNFNL